MSQLILLRQRIKAIETIKKITHAMRLISMSSHAHLKNRQNSFGTYTQNLKKLLSKIQKIVSKTTYAPIPSNTAKNEKVLICVISSQKGLCGTFNSTLVHYFNRQIQSFDQSQISLFLIGKKIIDALSRDYSEIIVAADAHFSLKTVPDVIAKINAIMESFDRVVVISNTPKTFFIQKPQINTIIPLEWNEPNGPIDDFAQYEEQTNLETVFENLIKEYTNASLEYFLLQSLIAEHAARFIAMDSSTRNAHTLLEEKKLEYNKLRQAKITKELTELSGIFTL